ncbi:MAG: hypothetical protein LBP82_01515, partial [Candidatus Methanoplasma sp.]|nr:hypothetical protein [Candidatus Methanoplasma sp.]
METEELLWASVFAITMAVLVSASVSDWKRREVSDIHWIVLGTIGLIVIFSNSVYLTGFRWEYVLLVAGAAMILLDILWDRKFNMFLFYLPMALL